MVHRAIALGTVCAVAEEDSDALLSQHAPAEAAQAFLHKNARAWTLGHCRSYEFILQKTGWTRRDEATVDWRDDFDPTLIEGPHPTDKELRSAQMIFAFKMLHKYALTRVRDTVVDLHAIAFEQHEEDHATFMDEKMAMEMAVEGNLQ